MRVCVCSRGRRFTGKKPSLLLSHQFWGNGISFTSLTHSCTHTYMRTVMDEGVSRAYSQLVRVNGWHLAGCGYPGQSRKAQLWEATLSALCQLWTSSTTCWFFWGRLYLCFICLGLGFCTHTFTHNTSDGQIKLVWSIESLEPIVSKMGSLLEASVTVTSPGEVPGCSRIRQASWWTGF